MRRLMTAAPATVLSPGGVSTSPISYKPWLPSIGEQQYALEQGARRMAEAGVNIEVQYSDHANRLILVVDDAQRAGWVAAAWTADDDAR